MWQTLAAEWRLPGTAAGQQPISAERLAAYLKKAMREAKRYTGWTEPDEQYEAAVQELAAFALTSDEVAAALDGFTEVTAEAVRANILGQKLLQLTMPGVPDVYQGCEVVDLSLVDPDNRREVDFYRRAGILASLGDGAPSDLDAQKLLVTSRALRHRREHADAYRGPSAEYHPIASTTGHAVAFSRGVGDEVAAITVVTRLVAKLAERDGWGDHTLFLPDGEFRNLFTDEVVSGGQTPVADVLGTYPVALLVPEQAGE